MSGHLLLGLVKWSSDGPLARAHNRRIWTKKKKATGEKANKKKIRMWCRLARGLVDLRGADVGPVL